MKVKYKHSRGKKNPTSLSPLQALLCRLTAGFVEQQEKVFVLAPLSSKSPSEMSMKMPGVLVFHPY